METQLAHNLLTLASVYGAAKNLKETTVGKSVALDGKFFSRIRAGEATFTARKYDEIIIGFSKVWPANLDWPKGIVRPEVPKKGRAA